MFKLFLKRKKGFTLLELLVVIAIIGLFAAITVILLSNSRMKSRDAKRIRDLNAIQKALELYYNANNKYPMNLDELVALDLLSAKPVDPYNRGVYTYRYCVDGLQSKYHLGAVLEDRNNAALKTDFDLKEGQDGCAFGSFDGTDRKNNNMYDLAP